MLRGPETIVATNVGADVEFVRQQNSLLHGAIGLSEVDDRAASPAQLAVDREQVPGGNLGCCPRFRFRCTEQTVDVLVSCPFDNRLKLRSRQGKEPHRPIRGKGDFDLAQGVRVSNILVRAMDIGDHGIVQVIFDVDTDERSNLVIR